jgi:predicted RNase H-like HicB family nuclease
MKYVAVLEEADDGGWGAFLPDLPGCVAIGETKEEAERLIREAVPLHIEALRENGAPVPEPWQYTLLVELA